MNNRTNPTVVAHARGYVERHGEHFGLLPFDAKPSKLALDPALGARTAAMYARLKDRPNHRRVKESYDALKRETLAQYLHLRDHGVDIRPWQKPGQPYANSDEMRRDVAENNRLHYFPTGDVMQSSHPLMEKTGIVVDGYDQTYNDLFRAVHDYFGHAMHGHQFGPQGELRAWAEHARMYSPAARPALSAETHGQNSWVNFGPGSHKPVTERPYAEQKAAVLPRGLWPEKLARQEHPDVRGFNRHHILNPDDDTGRLAFADWLADHNDPRELIVRNHRMPDQYGAYVLPHQHLPDVETGHQVHVYQGAPRAYVNNVHTQVSLGEATSWDTETPSAQPVLHWQIHVPRGAFGKYGLDHHRTDVKRGGKNAVYMAPVTPDQLHEFIDRLPRNLQKTWRRHAERRGWHRSAGEPTKLARGEHDVSGEPRAADGKWTSGGGGSRVAELLKVIPKLPGKIVKKTGQLVKDKYRQTEAKYGKTYARLAVGALVVGLPVPAPGASMLLMGTVLAVAKLHQRLKGKPEDAQADPGKVREARGWLARQLFGRKGAGGATKLAMKPTDWERKQKTWRPRWGPKGPVTWHPDLPKRPTPAAQVVSDIQRLHSNLDVLHSRMLEGRDADAAGTREDIADELEHQGDPLAHVFRHHDDDLAATLEHTTHKMDNPSRVAVSDYLIHPNNATVRRLEYHRTADGGVAVALRSHPGPGQGTHILAAAPVNREELHRFVDKYPTFTLEGNQELRSTANQLARPAYRRPGVGASVAESYTVNAAKREEIAKSILKEAGLTPAVVRTVLAHEPGRGVRTSVLQAITKHLTPDAAKYVAAWWGLLAREKAVTVFHPGDAGADRLHVLTARLPVADLGEYLGHAGVPSFSVEEHPAGSRAYFVNHGGALNQTVKRIVRGLPDASHSSFRGTGFRLGSGQGSDADARAHFRSVIRDYEATVAGTRRPAEA